MKQPNFLFVIGDQHRADFCSFYPEPNGKTLTPNLALLAQSGTVFSRAFCTAPLCSPSRAALALGRYGMNSGCFTNLHRPAGSMTFMSQLAAAGYQTAMIGKAHMEIHHYQADYTGPAHKNYLASLGWNYSCEVSGNGMLQTGIKCAYSEFLKNSGMFKKVLEYYRTWGYFMDKKQADEPFYAHNWPFAEELQETSFVAEQAVCWLKQHDKKQPFFLHVGFPAPHSPTEPNEKSLSLYNTKDETLPIGEKCCSRTLAGRTGYRAMISQVDHNIGRLISVLKERNLFDNTIIIYTADHGEMAGDHGLFGKTAFFESSIKIPLLICGPGIKKQSSAALAELLDLGRTVTDLAGINRHKNDQGKSLLPLISGGTGSHRNTVYCEMGCDKMLFDGRYKICRGEPQRDNRKLGKLHLDKPVNIPAGPVSIYDLENDPLELNDLAQDRELRLLLCEKLLDRINENTQTQEFLDRGKYRPLE